MCEVSVCHIHDPVTCYMLAEVLSRQNMLMQFW